MSDISRRDLMKRGGMIAVGLTTPAWIARLAQADLVLEARGQKPLSDRILVICQLSGGNDGLNTVVPFSDTRYYAARPQLAIAESQVLPLDARLGLHPSLGGMKTLYDEGKVAIVQNVGYPEPNRSHFKSMDIWHTASPEGTFSTGWLGRHFDLQLQSKPLNPVVALGLSTEKPLALNAKNASVPCFASLADIQQLVGDPDAERRLRQIQGDAAASGSAIRAVQDASKTALDAMSELEKRLGTYAPKEKYGTDAFGRGFQQISHLIGASPATKLVYFSAGGFDTHARQPDAHANLLKGLGDGLLAFQREMEALGKADQVLVLVFSEFGRRVHENNSMGTDHGAAAPMFLVGRGVKGGIHGNLPNLGDLNRGDLRHDVDFRQVYATALDEWLAGDSGVVLGSKFDHVPVLR